MNDKWRNALGNERFAAQVSAALERREASCKSGQPQGYRTGIQQSVSHITENRDLFSIPTQTSGII
ncbi:hypothetical protein [Nitrosomonas sp. Nm33]|uniref:hypothetical protein n=1 Tax=Nitrosomonas sp. Nm33 TaxID=133724 RepID=UPI000B87B336|nr:hypothetical protein [Nitrosomonas sp. Nm33]